ncbi:DUF6293 family protein [Haloprofundus salinisoli]|uniref:HFX_2341 family transcriptional regulator domain-containing protein n=1 Tax=Haloprofundus salinisoli TaxID=2876193 RepID=UPI001CCF08C9|nr:DUF6293 family protein [Haloprofundus salinisoli]
MDGSRDIRSMRRVQIAPLGYERDRVFLPATRLNADRLYLLVESGDDSTISYHETLRSDLEEAGVEVDERELNLHDVYDVMGVTTTVAAKHADDEVLVNISSGTNVAAVGAAIACMTTHATAFSVEPETYGHDIHEAPLTRGVVDIGQLPDYPIESPTSEQISVMGYVRERTDRGYTVHKRDLIEFSEREELSFMTESPTENRQSKYRRLDAHVVDPLKSKGYLHLRRAGRRTLVSLTETGESVYLAFEHKLRYG